MQGMHLRLKEARKAMHEGQMIDHAKILSMQQNREHLSLVEIMELAALEFLQKQSL